jgi:hypothetical protein
MGDVRRVALEVPESEWPAVLGCLEGLDMERLRSGALVCTPGSQDAAICDVMRHPRAW